MTPSRHLGRLVSLVSLLLVSCGGGDSSGGGDSQPPPPPAAPKISYPGSAFSFSLNVAAQIIKARSIGGAVVSWSVTPSLPAGLTLDMTDGTISGTPTAASPVTPYVVTAANSGGQSTYTLTLAVGPAPILDVGHTNALALMRFSGSALLSLDAAPPAGPATQPAGHWLLQDYASGTFLASGDLQACSNPFNCIDPAVPYGRYPQVDLAGDVMIDPVGGGQYTPFAGQPRSAPTGVEVRSASTGQVLATISGQFWWYQLASDGSYIVTASDKALTVYTPAGAQLFSLPGLYRTAVTFSTPSAIKVAFLTCPGNPPACPKPAGTDVIETIAVPSGSPRATPSFQGTFYAWFQDGARFLTTLGSTVSTYSSGGVQLDSTQVQPFNQAGTAQGPWWWTFGEAGTTKLNIYKVGASAAPTFSGSVPAEPIIVSSGPTLAGFSNPNGGAGPGHQVTVIDLSGPTPVSASYTAPDLVSGYAAASAAVWAAGDIYGVIVDGASLAGPPRFLTLGAVQSIAAGSSYYSVATASGEIRYFNASTNTSAGTIDFPSLKLATSSDGTVLAATDGSLSLFQGDGPLSQSVNIYSLPGATSINEFAYSPPRTVAISLSGSGTVLAQVPANNSGCTADAVAVTGGVAIWCDTTGTVDKAELSPDGTLVAASTQRFSSPNPVTRIYQSGVLVTAVPGWIVGWLDNTRLLVDNYQVAATPPNDTVYLGNIIYGAAGNVVGKPSLPEALDYAVIASDAVYSPTVNVIYSVTMSAPIWMSADSSSGIGAASASEVVFTSGTLVLAQPH